MSALDQFPHDAIEDIEHSDMELAQREIDRLKLQLEVAQRGCKVLRAQLDAAPVVAESLLCELMRCLMQSTELPSFRTADQFEDFESAMAGSREYLALLATRDLRHRIQTEAA